MKSLNTFCLLTLVAFSNAAFAGSAVGVMIDILKSLDGGKAVGKAGQAQDATKFSDIAYLNKSWNNLAAKDRLQLQKAIKGLVSPEHQSILNSNPTKTSLYMQSLLKNKYGSTAVDDAKIEESLKADLSAYLSAIKKNPSAHTAQMTALQKLQPSPALKAKAAPAETGTGHAAVRAPGEALAAPEVAKVDLDNSINQAYDPDTLGHKSLQELDNIKKWKYQELENFKVTMDRVTDEVDDILKSADRKKEFETRLNVLLKRAKKDSDLEKALQNALAFLQTSGSKQNPENVLAFRRYVLRDLVKKGEISLTGHTPAEAEDLLAKCTY